MNPRSKATELLLTNYLDKAKLLMPSDLAADNLIRCA
jgi:hypothetical protein